MYIIVIIIIISGGGGRCDSWCIKALTDDINTYHKLGITAIC